MTKVQLSMLLELIHRMAPACPTIRISGEKGLGKMSLAHHLYRMHPDKHSRFIVLNCAQQWQVQRGNVITHGSNEDPAWLNNFYSGSGHAVYFLADVEYIPLDLQHRLAEIITSADSPCPRPWLIASSIEPLEHHVAEGRCSADLLAAMDMVHVSVAPLRAKPEVISRLLEDFLSQHRTLHDSSPVGMPDARTMDYFIRHRWPGNIRQLRMVTNRALATGQWPLKINDWPCELEASSNGEIPGLKLAGLMNLAQLSVKKGKALEILLAGSNLNNMGLLDLVFYDEALSQIDGEPSA